MGTARQKHGDASSHASHWQASTQDEPLHVSLELLFPAECQQRWLAIDPGQSIVSLLCFSQESAQLRIRRHQAFTLNALRALIALLAFPMDCPHCYLLSALDMEETMLPRLLYLSSSDPLILPFHEKAAAYETILLTTRGNEREQHLRYLRRMMTEVMRNLPALGLQAFALRGVGYRLQPFIPARQPRRLASLSSTLAPA